MSDAKINAPAKLDRSGINRIIQMLGALLVFGAMLFGAAGCLDWWEAWVFLVIYLAGVPANGLWSLRHNPEMINERGRIGENAKSWDKVIGISTRFSSSAYTSSPGWMHASAGQRRRCG